MLEDSPEGARRSAQLSDAIREVEAAWRERYMWSARIVYDNGCKLVWRHEGWGKADMKAPFAIYHVSGRGWCPLRNCPYATMVSACAVLYRLQKELEELPAHEARKFLAALEQAEAAKGKP